MMTTGKSAVPSTDSPQVQAVRWVDGALELLDQRRLPDEVTRLRLERSAQVAEAIGDMVVRGAPAIGVAAAYAVVLAARERYGSPVVVVDFGTSTNFDVVGADGAYLGGAIAPGMEVSLNALISGTAALRLVEFTPPRSPIGKGTVEAIQSGALYGHAGLVDGIMDRIVGEFDGPVERVATGGLASTIVPHCRTVDTIDDFLTLEGLRLVFERNQDDG